jgi:hypothetical protein
VLGGVTMDEIIDMCQKIKNSKLTFVLNPDNAWDVFDDNFQDTVNTTWQEVKFLDESCERLHASMEHLPNNTGGIYVFIAKPEIIPNTHLYILYVGRAFYTSSQNLRKRCSSYISDDRPKIYSMVRSWGKYLYIRYLPLTDNNTIDRLESELINTIFPPCNDMYPNRVIRMAMKAAFM